MTLRRQFLLVFGEILFQIGFLWKSLYTMVCSRALFGLGAETLFPSEPAPLEVFPEGKRLLLVAVIINLRTFWVLSPSRYLDSYSRDMK